MSVKKTWLLYTLTYLAGFSTDLRIVNYNRLYQFFKNLLFQ